MPVDKVENRLLDDESYVRQDALRVLGKFAAISALSVAPLPPALIMIQTTSVER